MVALRPAEANAFAVHKKSFEGKKAQNAGSDSATTNDIVAYYGTTNTV